MISVSAGELLPLVVAVPIGVACLLALLEPMLPRRTPDVVSLLTVVAITA